MAPLITRSRIRAVFLIEGSLLVQITAINNVSTLNVFSNFAAEENGDDTDVEGSSVFFNRDA